MECSEQLDGWGKIVETDKDGSQRVGFDLFNFEDDRLQLFLAEYIGKKASNTDESSD